MFIHVHILMTLCHLQESVFPTLSIVLSCLDSHLAIMLFTPCLLLQCMYMHAYNIILAHSRCTSTRLKRNDDKNPRKIFFAFQDSLVRIQTPSRWCLTIDLSYLKLARKRSVYIASESKTSVYAIDALSCVCTTILDSQHKFWHYGKFPKPSVSSLLLSDLSLQTLL